MKTASVSLTSGMICALLALMCGLLLIGCAAPSGKTLTRERLNLDAERAVLAADRQADGSAVERRVSATAVVEAPEMVVTPVAEPASGVLLGTPWLSPAVGRATGARGYSKFVERWTVARGSQSSNYLVTFVPDGNGGTSIAVRPE